MIKLSKFLRPIVNKAVEKSPTILTGLGVAGVFGTAFMVYKATPKALQVIRDAEYDVDRRLTRKEIAQLTWKCFAPAVGMGIVTSACIIGANSINLRRNAALAGMYSLSEKVLKEYQAKVVEKIGDEEEKKIRREIRQDKLDLAPVDTDDVIIGSGNTLCYDVLAGRYCWGDIDSINRAITRISKHMVTDTFVPVNDFYREMDWDTSVFGDLMGWSVDDIDLESQFSSDLTKNGVPCLVLDFSIEPRYLKRDY